MQFNQTQIEAEGVEHSGHSAADRLSLADWRRRMAEMYVAIREAAGVYNRTSRIAEASTTIIGVSCFSHCLRWRNGELNRRPARQSLPQFCQRRALCKQLDFPQEIIRKREAF